MADVKISALPTASVVNPADILVLNQGGTTKTATKTLVVSGLATTAQISGIATTAQLSAFQNSAQVQALTTAQLSAISIDAGEGLSGGGNISANRTLQLAALTTEAISLGSASQVPAITIDTFGRIASASSATITPGAIGAFATSAIIGIENGGTGAFVPFDARTNLGAMAVDQQAGADLSGPLTAPNVVKLYGNPISQLNPSGGQVLQWSGSAWEPASLNLDFAPIDSPAFTGTPTAPTAAAQTNTTQIATTEFVISNRGDSYLTQSDSTNTIGNGTKTFEVEAGLSYTPTQDCTIVFNSSNHMHGVVVTYSNTTLVVDVTQHTGSGSYSVWTINVGGLTTAAGALLSANNLSDVASPATSLTNLGGVSTARSVSAGTGLSGGGDLTANRTLSLADTAVTAGSYGSSSQIAALTVDAQGRLTAASSIAFTSQDVQTFPTVGTATWTKLAGAKRVRVQLWSGGGGGASGRKGAAGSIRCGGGGGGSGAYYDTILDASILGATETVTIGVGGTAGGAITVNSTNGLAGGQGGTTSFGSHVSLFGGNGGSGGTNTTGNAGGGGVGGNTGGGASSTGSNGVNGTPSTTGTTCTQASGGGAAGAGITSANVASAGAVGGRFPLLNYAGGAGGGVGVSGGNGTSMAALPTTGVPCGASAGGSGGSSITGNAGAGGNGGFPGGGGAGGGAAVDDVGNSGAGGVGGSGAAIITTYFY